MSSGRPYVPWLRDEADVRHRCLHSVAIVGIRAATAYGAHVTAELSRSLGARGWTVVSGVAYRIDGVAHRDLLAAVAGQDVLVSESPPGRRSVQRCFLSRSRLIAALTRGTVGWRQRRALQRLGMDGPLGTGASLHGRARAGDIRLVRRLPHDHQPIGVICVAEARCDQDACVIGRRHGR